jgi:hypothetical protein
MWFTVAQGLDALKNHGGFLALLWQKRNKSGENLLILK